MKFLWEQAMVKDDFGNGCIPMHCGARVVISHLWRSSCTWLPLCFKPSTHLCYLAATGWPKKTRLISTMFGIERKNKQ